MATIDSDMVINGFVISEASSYKNSIRRLERRNRGLAGDIMHFIARMTEEVIGRGLPLSALHIERLQHNHDFLEAKRVHCPSLGRGSREGIRLVFSLDSANRSILLVDVFSKGDQEVWLPRSPDSGHRRYSNVTRQAFR